MSDAVVSGSVRLDRAGPVARLTFANPPTHTLTDPQVRELDRLTAELATDRELRVLVLTGESDDIFIAHYEVGELSSAADARQSGENDRGTTDVADPSALHRFNRITRRLESLDAVTVAAINGTAMGGGCELTLGCDLRVMKDGPYRYGLPETGVGIIPGAGGTQRMARMLGSAKALDLILHGAVTSPGDALELGLVHRVFPASSWQKDVDAFVATLAARAPIALAAAKRAIRAGLERDLDQGLLLEQAEFARTLRSKDAAGAMRAWLRGEPFEFKGE